MMQANRAARTISGRSRDNNHTRNNNSNDEEDGENALDITDDDVNMLTSSIALAPRSSWREMRY